MSYYYHKDKSIYFQHQYENATEHLIPFTGIEKSWQVLEIGCGEGGVLKAYVDQGCKGVGVELSEFKINNAKRFLEQEIKTNKIKLYSENIYNPIFVEAFAKKFDLIILKDVIEHIHDQAKLMRLMKSFLKEGGAIFFGFPPWQMPFGGHQQVCESKILRKLPYFHLLPSPMYRSVLRLFGEKENTIEGLLEIKSTGISIGQFISMVRSTGYQKVKSQYYLVNPIYQYKFGLKPKTQLPFITKVPYFRNFVTTCVYYLIK